MHTSFNLLSALPHCINNLWKPNVKDLPNLIDANHVLIVRFLCSLAELKALIRGYLLNIHNRLYETHPTWSDMWEANRLGLLDRAGNRHQRCRPFHKHRHNAGAESALKEWDWPCTQYQVILHAVVGLGKAPTVLATVLPYSCSFSNGSVGARILVLPVSL